MQYIESESPQRYYGLQDAMLRSYCEDIRYSESQLEYIRYGIENGIDVSTYANPNIPEDEMRKLLGELLASKRLNK